MQLGCITNNLCVKLFEDVSGQKGKKGKWGKREKIPTRKGLKVGGAAAAFSLPYPRPKKKISINRAEQRATGGGDSAQLQPLSEIEECAVALVGIESRSATTRGLAEPSLESRQPEKRVSLQPSIAPPPFTSEDEEEEPHYSRESIEEEDNFPHLLAEDKEEEDDDQDIIPELLESAIVVLAGRGGMSLRPSALILKRHRDQAVLIRQRQGAIYCERRPYGGQVSEMCNRLL
uniref:uncharacterized protein n=1 Tax=Pristiophorus japonicus TaxID=55135 RepID=UPI00398F6DEB